MDKLAIIGTGYMARIIAERAKELGIESHCFSNDTQSVAAEVADCFHCVNILDVDSLLSACRQLNIDGVVATTELTIWPAAYVAKHLGLPGNSIEVAKQITDKYAIRNKVQTVNGLYQPTFCIYTEGLPPKISKYPVVIKPIAAGGKRGVSVVNSADAIGNALTAAISVSKLKGALIEEYLEDGQEYSVESLSYHAQHYILQITQKDSSGPPNCVELGHHQPAELSAEMRATVIKVIADTLTAAGITEGPCHTEIKIIDGRIYLIEINGRPGGDHIAYPLTELSTGYPYITGIIMAALGKFREEDLAPLEHNHCGVYFVTTQTAFLKEVFDNCESKPWLYKKNKVTDELAPITHNDGFNTNYFIYFDKDKKPEIFDTRR